jgi:phosphoribosylamine--glycine ligase
MVGSEIRDVEGVVTAGEYVLVAYGKGATVEASRQAAYKVVDQISWPPHINVRTDIGKRLEQGLKELHRHGYATDVNYGN